MRRLKTRGLKGSSKSSGGSSTSGSSRSQRSTTSASSVRRAQPPSTGPPAKQTGLPQTATPSKLPRVTAGAVSVGSHRSHPLSAAGRSTGVTPSRQPSAVVPYVSPSPKPTPKSAATAGKEATAGPVQEPEAHDGDSPVPKAPRRRSLWTRAAVKWLWGMSTLSAKQSANATWDDKQIDSRARQLMTLCLDGRPDSDEAGVRAFKEVLRSGDLAFLSPQKYGDDPSFARLIRSLVLLSGKWLVPLWFRVDMLPFRSAGNAPIFVLSPEPLVLGSRTLHRVTSASRQTYAQYVEAFVHVFYDNDSAVTTDYLRFLRQKSVSVQARGDRFSFLLFQVSLTYNVMLAAANFASLSNAERDTIVRSLYLVRSITAQKLGTGPKLRDDVRNVLVKELVDMLAVLWPTTTYTQQEGLDRIYGDAPDNSRGFFGHWLSSRKHLQRSLINL
ncbi:hypothetical protein V5799_026727 [Amblyomma americanum]|uniref:Uncharacterized protein n=1 Tax=Amblyomma americanum TaxID=6943 RepID=A0AAQ4DHS0_AMBAM